MQPSEKDVANFLTFAPDAGEGKAFLYLEGATSVEEAVGQFYDNPDKYSQRNLPDGEIRSKDPQLQVPPQVQVPVSPPSYAPPQAAPVRTTQQYRPHTNAVIEAGNIRARDEQEMQNLLQNVQIANRIYNSDIEPEHEYDGYCGCSIHQYKRQKINRLNVQKMWSKAVMYPGEKSYHDCYQTALFTSNPYRYQVVSPYGYNPGRNWYGPQIPSARYYTLSVQQTIQLNATLNEKAQANVNAIEPRVNIWDADRLEASMSNLSINSAAPLQADGKPAKPPRFAGLKRALSIKTPEERAAQKSRGVVSHARDLREAIMNEERGRWPDEGWHRIVYAYQEKVGMTRKIADLRARQPTQYLHLLRAGYFEPIPVAWAELASNPLKFSIEAAAGWRGITPAWRGYEDTAEERLYWVLNHREGSVGVRLKPDFISAMNMARARMASAVEPPPAYFSPNDTCHVQHTSTGYSKQVMPPPFRAYDAPEVATDDTMILLDVSGSMDFDPVRPDYDQYLITGYVRSTQPKNKDVAKAIIRRFTDAMINHDHNFKGYQLTTFSSESHYIGYVNHRNLDGMWRNIRIGGGTRVMTGWQKVKDLHFRKHSESATYHPVYGWQAGPQTPILRLLLLLDGEATDMDEFELDLLGLNWVHLTIFLIGVDGCPHHHRHANELQRISEVNHHVSFVDAQGNTPERFVTHELLKRHLGYDVSMREFEELEQPPPYEA